MTDKFYNNPVLRAFTTLFGIKRGERAIVAVMLTILIAINALVVCKYYGVFTPPNAHYWHLFISKFHISGFDPITYSVVSDWTAGYNVYRHPLLAFFMYVPYLINQALMWATGINCALFVVASIQIFCALYAALFCFRIFHEIAGTSRADAILLTLFFYSFAFVMLSAIVPDHFIISMMLLTLALYVSGKLIAKGRKLKIWQTVLYFFLTAGTSLNNGLKIYLSDLFVNGKSIFRPKFFFGAIILPAALVWGAGKLSYDHIVWPRDVAAKAARAKAKAAKEKKAKAAQLLQARADSIAAANGDTTVKTAKVEPAKPKKKRRVSKGAPISHGQFLDWTDITTSRTSSVVENLFGESIQLHEDYLLGDVLRSRPIIVHYRSWMNYVVEAAILVMFIIGIWCGRKSRFFWLAMSYFALDMALHIGLGFGINEVYIMSAHWIYIIPIAMAYALRHSPKRLLTAQRCAIAALTLFLWIHNVRLIVQYLYFT